MRIGVLLERAPGERRVAVVPDVAKRLIAAGHEVLVEHDAGAHAHLSNEQYTAAGANVTDLGEVLSAAELLCKVQAPLTEEVGAWAPGTSLVSFLQPTSHLDLVRALVSGRIDAYSLDLLPRISRAQSMDALSSQALVSGYRAVLMGAERLPKFLPMFMTAAGTIPPAKVLVLGAGVAGLQAIATARRLGAVVRANDVRPAAKEEVQSLGATFVSLELESLATEGGYAKEASEEYLQRQRDLIASEVANADLVITTAAVPGRRAPVLVTSEMLDQMAAGSVVVDLAAESGGNCEGSVAGEETVRSGVTICGCRNLPSSMPLHASALFSRNISAFLELLAPAGELAPDFADEIVDATCVTRSGEVRHAPTIELLGQ